MAKISDWLPSVDIYNVVESVENLKKKFIEDENETTLAAGIFGFLTDTEAKKIQTAAIMTGELGNEMFPQRAKLDKNVVTHAIYCNVEDLNAVPAHMTINLAVKESDLDLYMRDNEFIFDHTCPIYIGDYEFHLDYDIVLRRYKRASTDKWIYSARYDMDETNIISNINMPYLNQPFLMNFNNYKYIFFQALVRQVTIETTEDRMISASIIDNKSFTFTFANQLAGFDVYVTNSDNVTTRLTPYMYGQSVEAGVTDYCWYLYMSDDTIRIGFDNLSYIPGLNEQIRIVAYTTLGASGNFSYKSTEEDAGFYVDFESSAYSYKKITCFANCATDSTDGKDKKSIDELKNLVPKLALSRGYITTETDLNNYFNLISDENNRLALSKKVDNQLNRIWYCYLVIKDEANNVIPTNTLPIKVDLTNEDYVLKAEGEDERYIIPCGTTFSWTYENGYAEYIAEESIPEKYSEEYFGDTYYYRTIYNIIVNIDPLYCAFYLSIINRDSYFQYNWVNEDLDLGFVVNTYHLERSLLSNKDEYRFTFRMIQSVNENMGLYYTYRDTESDSEVVVNNLKVFLVIYKQHEAYRYVEAEVTAFDEANYALDYIVTLKTDDQFDTLNQIKLLDLYEVGYDSKNYGYFEDNSQAFIYIYGKFDQEYGRSDADTIIPASVVDGYSLINIYELADGLTLFENYTNVMNTRVRVNKSGDGTVVRYDITGIPMVGEHFFMSEDNVTYFMNQLDLKKAYIDYCLLVLENNMDIDFKFFNTYGYSKTYTIGDKEETSLGHIDITMKFRLKLVNSSDTSTKNDIINYIKTYIENMNNAEGQEELHIPNLLHDIKEQYDELIIYIEFMNFNDNRLGVNHIEVREELDSVHIPKEFINVRNRLTADGDLEPWIDMELVV